MLDQQTDQLWSRSRSRVITRPERESRVAIVDVDWYCLRADVVEDAARVFIAAAERLLPEAVPRRFGEDEPLQGKYSDSGVDGFAAAWAVATETLGTTGTVPCVGGHIDAGPAASYPDRFWSAGLEFLADPISQPGWRAALRRLFVMLADALPAFYATAQVTRGHIWSGRSLFADAETEWSMRTLRRREDWLGLPPQPTWWSWFGQPYREFAALLPADRITATDNGVLYEAASTPVPSDDLPALTRFLPGTLFAVSTPNPYGPAPFHLRHAEQIPGSLRRPSPRR